MTAVQALVRFFPLPAIPGGWRVAATIVFLALSLLASPGARACDRDVPMLQPVAAVTAEAHALTSIARDAHVVGHDGCCGGHGTCAGAGCVTCSPAEALPAGIDPLPARGAVRGAARVVRLMPVPAPTIFRPPRNA